MLSKLRYILLPLFFLVIFSCNKNLEEDKKWIFNLDNQFELGMREILSSTERALEFKLTALDPVECDSSSFVLKTKSSVSKLEIEVTDLTYDANCSGSGSFPEGTISIPSRNNTYDLNINILDFIDHKGVFSITNDQFILDISDSQGLIAPVQVLNKIPNFFIWGYYQTFNQQEAKKITDFFAENNLIETTEGQIPSGTYSYFYVDRTGKISMEDLPEKGNVETFSFLNVNLMGIKEKLTEFKSTYPDINLHFYFSDGSIL